ncbi:MULTISPECIES: DNA adenine methylase [Desulfovibrionaceae]|uniref:site-specific DNA-methyltransferase (adenine-specific) n=2 Tax=Desulfovibrionaceae TaxID=194924 RepID=A0A6P1ZLZ8_9BACT|nr:MULTISPECIES: DNA adenine methylase [Desulfovibrionaceae]TVM34949.1 DNA methyltransferase [Oceanidesulfovibrio marinus]WFS61692.1 DNA adenine methylase [Pseudodesulfovibrio thermohalotolerans]
MELFATDLERLAFLLEADAALTLDPDTLGSEAAEQSAPEELPPEKRPKYITNYIGSKQKLVDWIWKHTPEGTGTVLDAFSGSAVVAYMYKTKGLQVIANDRLRYCHHAAKAIIENNSVRLSEDEIEALLADNAKAGSFVQDNFKGIFFAKGVHALIDTIRANCDKLSGFKKDIALFGLGKTCMSGKGGFGHFSSSTDYGRRQDTPDEFKDRLRKNLQRINALVFDNDKENKAYRQDINDLLPKAKADLAYFDPPYATEFSTTNYERAYHFVEGLMTYWEGLEIKADTKVKYYETDHKTVTKANANEFFQTFLGNAKHIPHWLISYRDHAYPNEQEMKRIIGSFGKQSRMRSKDHHYAITSKHGEASNAKERLFVCAPGAKASAEREEKPVPMAAAANFHTSIPVDIQLGEGERLTTEAMDVGSAGDPQFSFVLCRTGTNKNGDHFTAEELSGRHMTAVNKKVDLQHSQEFNDIVGGIVAADYLEDDNGGRVECVGELYVHDTPAARLAYKLMKRGIISQVSMECDYQEGECSVCHKRFQNKADYCTHLRKFKGRDFNGQPVFEILHGVTFTGLGLLDRKGADENARILQVASLQSQPDQSQPEGDSTMEDKTKPTEDPAAKTESDAAKKKPAQQEGDPARVSDLEKENRQLKAQVAELQKRVQELEAEQKAAACRSRAKKLLTRLEKQGLSFASDEDREAELKRLAELSDEAFAATEAAYERLPKSAKADKDKEEKPADSDQGGKPAAKASTETPLRSDAGVRPHDVDDRKVSLEDRLRDGFMAAYRNRVGEDSPEHSQINA